MSRPILALLTRLRRARLIRRRDEGRRAQRLRRSDAGRHHATKSRRTTCSRALSTSPPAIAYFPPGTVFLVVVDPGVGSSRRGIAAECGDYRFVAPDNGVLSAVFREHPPKRVVELSERRYFRPTVSRTFEGRDRFAPAAAWLLKGVDLGALGRPASEPVLARPAAPGDRRRHAQRRRAARRSLRQRHHQHRPAQLRAVRAGASARDRHSAAAGGRAWSAPTPRSARTKSARCSAAPTCWSWRRGPPRARALGSARRPVLVRRSRA